MKKSFSSWWKILNCSTNASLYSPGFLVILASMASVATKSSGPALRWSLFCIVCLISCCSMIQKSIKRNLPDYSKPNDNNENKIQDKQTALWSITLRSWGISFRWAMSLIRVRGTDAVNSALKDGKHGWILRITSTS